MDDDDDPQIRLLGPHGLDQGCQFFACPVEDGMFEVSHGSARGHRYSPAADVGNLDPDIYTCPREDLLKKDLINTTDSLRSHFTPFFTRRRRRSSSSSHSIIVSSPNL